MLLYTNKIENHKIGDNTPYEEIAQMLGWTLTIDSDKVERAYDGSFWEKGYAPKKPEPTVEEQNEAIRKKRETEYQSLTDPLTLRKMRKDALGEWTPDDEKQYLDELRRISDDINAKYPYVEEYVEVEFVPSDVKPLEEKHEETPNTNAK